MKHLIRVAVDAMGGDNAPAEIVKGAVRALHISEDLFISLVGDAEKIAKELGCTTYPKERLEVVPASEMIEMSEHPVNAIRRKKDSSMVVAMRLVKEGKADAFLSAGNSGAVLVGGISIIGRLKGIERTPFGAIVPCEKGSALILDSGANVDVRASHLCQFAKLGTLYLKHTAGIENPRVGILNIGSEEEKGNALVQEAMPLLKADESIHFIGSVEARDIPTGVADVIVCDGFAGNVFLKTYEGTSKVLVKIIKGSLLSSLKMKIGALFIKNGLKKTLAQFDAAEHGGAPLLGCKGLVIKCHGNATAKEISNGCLQCLTYVQNDVTGIIKSNMMI